MRRVISYILIVVGLVLPFYLFISGIIQTVNGVSPFIAKEVIIGVIKIVFCGLGAIPAWIGSLLLQLED